MAEKLPPHLEHGGINSEVILPPAEQQTSVNGIDHELTGGDKVFIEGCIRQGMDKESTFFSLTNQRIKSGQSRIIKPPVDKHYDAVLARRNSSPCAITGQETTHIMTVKVKSGPNQFLVVEIPVNAGVVNAISQRGVQVSHEFSVASRVPKERLQSMEPTSKMLAGTKVVPLIEQD